VTGVSHNLNRDELMRRDIQQAMSGSEPPEVFFIEIKARGVEGARFIHETYGVPFHYMNNVPHEVDSSGNLLPGNRRLNEETLRVAELGAERFNSS